MRQAEECHKKHENKTKGNGGTISFIKKGGETTAFLKICHRACSLWPWEVDDEAPHRQQRHEQPRTHIPQLLVHLLPSPLHPAAPLPPAPPELVPSADIPLPSCQSRNVHLTPPPLLRRRHRRAWADCEKEGRLDLRSSFEERQRPPFELLYNV
jgi:hypothetical protein